MCFCNLMRHIFAIYDGDKVISYIIFLYINFILISRIALKQARELHITLFSTFRFLPARFFEV